MATILEFRPAMRQASVPQMKGRLATAPAEIVIFPGVRYERWTAPPVGKPKRRTKKRDKIILKD